MTKTEPRTLQVGLGERTYPIRIGSGVLDEAGATLAALGAARAIVITNPVVAGHFGKRLQRSLDGRGVRADVVEIPDGEAHKDLATLERVITRLLELRAERKTMLVALGGGVVGDLAGFAAAVYQRGMPFVQIPTTLLSQVDSSVGGKTAVNHPLGKNMIGAFYQPRAVLIDTDCLATLPPRELSAGLAEVIKYGAIRDVGFLSWLEDKIEALLAVDADALAYAIEVSCRIKAKVVASDEREEGERAILNLGHTFGHAIENGLGYGAWLHGEAVGAGMVIAAQVSARLGWIDDAAVTRLRDLLVRARLPVQAPALGFDRWMSLMGRDKKVESGTIRFVLLRALGEGVIGRDVPPGVLRAVLP